MSYPHIQLNQLPTQGIDEIEVKALSLDIFALFITLNKMCYQIYNEQGHPLYTDNSKDMREILLALNHLPQEKIFLEQFTDLYYQPHNNQKINKAHLELRS